MSNYPDIHQPSPGEMQRLAKLLAPWEWWLRPVFFGIETIPEARPLLFVGNHSIYGFLDIPLLFFALYRQRRIYLRGLGDHIHFKVPGWGEFLKYYGVVDGTPRNCARLMEAGESLLVFPGGAREALKRRDERHQLIWGERLGFVRMAIEHGCTIVPFSALGMDDALDVVWDADDMFKTRAGELWKQMGLRTDAIPPVVRGLGPTSIPRPERLYFSVRPAIKTASYQGQSDNEEACRELRERVRVSIETGFEELDRFRQDDPYRSFRKRLGEDVRSLAGRLWNRGGKS